MDGRLPEDDAGTAEAGHEVLSDDAHAGVRLWAQVGQNFLKVNRRLFTDQSSGYRGIDQWINVQVNHDIFIFCELQSYQTRIYSDYSLSFTYFTGKAV